MAELLTAGWKRCSLVDVKGFVSFTLWVCGCNLRCPFCHNWRLASSDPSLCQRVDAARIAGELEEVVGKVDYLHVTGGEPLLQAEAVAELFRLARRLGVKTSLNSNLTLPTRLERLAPLLDHAATDVRPAWSCGLKDCSWVTGRWLESLRILASHGVKVELRLLAMKAPVGEYISLLSQAVKALKGTEWYVVVNPLQCRPKLDPRDNEWCTRYRPSRSDVEEIVEAVKPILPEQAIVAGNSLTSRSWLRGRLQVGLL